MVRNMNGKIIKSSAFDPWFNLALEEHLLNNIEEKQIKLFLWQNNKSVLIGRNQNSRRICRYEKLENEGGKLARRVSGGGAVYNDPGTLNFSFLMDTNSFRPEHYLRVILRAIQSLGIRAQLSGDDDLIVGEKKFSGNVYYHGQGVSLLHGTIFVNIDFNKMLNYIKFSKKDDYIRSRVVNLTEINGNKVDIDLVVQSLVDSFNEIYGGDNNIYEVEPQKECPEKLYKKHSSSKWCYGPEPECDVSFGNRFQWGDIELCLKLKAGKIESAVIFSNTLEADLMLKIAEMIKGVPFRLDALIKRLDLLLGSREDRKIVNDIKIWLRSKI